MQQTDRIQSYYIQNKFAFHANKKIKGQNILEQLS
jgi:hypothetical protein